MNISRFRSFVLVLLVIYHVAPAQAGLDDDAPFQSDGVTRNSEFPFLDGRAFSDYPTHAEVRTGLRILPPTGTQLISGQRFDLRVETQIPAKKPPELMRLAINGKDVTERFREKIAAQGLGLESGTPKSALLFGASARNLSFQRPGIWKVEAVVNVDGVLRTIENTYPVAQSPFEGAKKGAGPKHVVFFLGDGMGLPIRTAARIVGRGIAEGQGKGRLQMDAMDDYGLVHTSSFDSIITDSAPGMANYITGMKQANNAVNVSVDNTPENNLDNPRVETFWEFLKRTRGWKTGVVTDAFATDATPAAVAAHSRARSARTAIAQQMIGHYQDGTSQPKTGYSALAELTQPLDVILGSGARDWLSKSNPAAKSFYQYKDQGRTDVDLFATVAPGLGYSTVRNLAELLAAPDDRRLLGIFTGEFRTTSSGLGPDNIPAVLDRRVARGLATIRGKDASAEEIGMNVVPPFGDACGATVGDCFRAVPSKVEMVKKAVSVLNRLAGKDKGWILLVEQSQTDKLGHILEYDRVIYEALELDESLSWVTKHLGKDALVLVTADHAQPETIIGVAMPSVTTVGGCFSGSNYPISLGSSANPDRPCPLQDAIGTFNDASFPTYVSSRNDGYPDDPDPLVKLVIEDGGRPTYSTNYLTNYQPLEPTGRNSSLPNPKRAPDGLLMTGNMPTRKVPQGPSKTEGNISIAPHSGDDVPLSASGRGAAMFGGVYENSELQVRMAAALRGATSRKQLKLGTDYPGVPAATPSAKYVGGL